MDSLHGRAVLWAQSVGYGAIVAVVVFSQAIRQLAFCAPGQVEANPQSFDSLGNGVQGGYFGLGSAKGKVDRRAVIVSALLLSAIVAVELLVNSR